MVLSTSILVMTIGLSALIAIRVERRESETTANVAQARFAAQSIVEVALTRMGNNPNWRTTYTHKVWTGKETYGDADVMFLLFDQVDVDLANDPTHAVRVFGKATVGKTVRVYSVLVDASSTQGTNLLKNADMESGTTAWTTAAVPGGGLLTSVKDITRTGPAIVLSSGRPTFLSGVGQDITASVTNGATYYTEVWVQSKVDDNLIGVVMVLDTSFGPQSVNFDVAHWGQDWYKVSGTLTPSWTGTLKAAYWHVAIKNGISDFGIDDALLTEGSGPGAVELTPVPGTWRREPAM